MCTHRNPLGVSFCSVEQRMRLGRPICTVLFTVACLCLLQGTNAVGQTFKITDLGTLGGNNSYATAISDGQVVGDSETGRTDTNGNPLIHAFSWTQAGGMVDLGTLGGDFSSVRAVSNGQVVGRAGTGSVDTYGAQVEHAFSWSGAGGMVDLGALDGFAHSTAVALSNGLVAGHAYNIDPDFGDPSEGRAVLWTQLTTWTPTPRPTRTPTPSPTRTATATITPTPAATSDPNDGGGGGCAITMDNRPGVPRGVVALLAPLALFLWWRGRR